MKINDLCLKLNDNVNISDFWKISERILKIDPYGARDAGASIDTITSDLILHPVDVINYLLDTIDDLQA